MLHIASGETTSNDWQTYSGDPGGIFVNIDTSTGEFHNTPHYICSLEGNVGHWRVSGVNAVYSPTSQSFSVYLSWADLDGSDYSDPKNPLTLQFAQDQNWHIKWTGIET